MSYEAVEAKVQTILQGLTSQFTASAQVTRGDYAVLDAGYDNCAVLYPGAYADNGYWANNTIDRAWTVHFDLFRRVAGDDAGAVSSFIALRDAVLGQLHAYPLLNGLAGTYAIQDTRADAPQWLFDDGDNGPFFIKCTFDIHVTELATVTNLEA